MVKPVVNFCIRCKGCIAKIRFFVSMAQDQKQEAIIGAAIKRFAHFGVTKTTMAEIAADLSFSKASLYYYFPDKLNLFAAVLQNIAEAGAKDHDEALHNEADPFKAMTDYLQKRTEFIIKYDKILEYLKTFSRQPIPEELVPVFDKLRKRELQRIITVLDKGLKQGTFKIADSKKTAELFYDFIDGFRYSILANRPNFFPDKKEMQAILRREVEFSTIFLKGLTI
ncbi:MAG: TetR/AcrR family transcriptional regulator [Chitinophagaceae bacterium]|nr:MAG: TetR/AcrR family transcriptional regulator [Chitinophagaceae bacterium]